LHLARSLYVRPESYGPTYVFRVVKVIEVAAPRLRVRRFKSDADRRPVLPGGIDSRPRHEKYSLKDRLNIGRAGQARHSRISGSLEVTRESSIRGSLRLASKNYDNDLKQFYVTLFSNASHSLYLANTIGAFTVELPRPIQVGPNKWEVVLYEISYPPNQVGTLRTVNVVGNTTVLVYTDLISPQYAGKALVRCPRTLIYPTM